VWSKRGLVQESQTHDNKSSKRLLLIQHADGFHSYWFVTRTLRYFDIRTLVHCEIWGDEEYGILKSVINCIPRPTFVGCSNQREWKRRDMWKAWARKELLTGFGWKFRWKENTWKILGEDERLISNILYGIHLAHDSDELWSVVWTLPSINCGNCLDRVSVLTESYTATIEVRRYYSVRGRVILCNDFLFVSLSHSWHYFVRSVLVTVIGRTAALSNQSRAAYKVIWRGVFRRETMIGA